MLPSNEMLDNAWSKLAIGHNKAFLVISSFPDFVDHLEIVDIHNMQRVYSYLLNQSDIIDIQATDHLLLLLSPIDLKVYTIALLPELTLLARYSTDSFFENMVISPDQGTLYSVTIDGIQTLNLRSFRQAVVFNETYPELMTSSFKAPWQARAITIGENNILVSVSREGVCIFSLQNASYPTQEWALAMPITDYYQPPLLFKQLLLIKKNSDEFSLWDMREPYKPKGIGKISLGNDHELFSMLAVQGEVWGTQGDALQRLDFSHGVLKGTPRHRDDIDAIAGSEMTVIVTGAEDTGNFPVSTLKFGFDDIMLQSSFLPKEQRLFPGEVRILPLNTQQLFTHSSDSFLRLSLEQMNKAPVPTWMTLQWSPTLLPPDVDRNRESTAMAVGTHTLFVLSGIDINIMDIRDPFDPRLAPIHLTTDRVGNPLDIALSKDGSILFKAKDAAELEVINVNSLSLSQQPTKTVKDPDVSVSYKHIDLTNDVACIQAANTTTSFVRLIDIRDPSNPAIKGAYFMDALAQDIAVGNETFSLPKSNHTVTAIAVADKTLYVLGEGNQSFDTIVHVVDIAEPLIPHLLIEPSARLTQAFRSRFLNRVRGLTVEGDRMFVTCDGGSIALFDLMSMTFMSEFDYRQARTSQPDTDSQTRLAVAKQESSATLFIADGESGLTMLDASDPHAVNVLGRYPSAGYAAKDVALYKDAVYMTNKHGLRVYDLRTWEMSIQPPAGHEAERNYYLRLNAIDKWGGTASYTFTVYVEGAPRLNYPLPSRYAVAGDPFSYSIPIDAFTDPNGDPITFYASFAPAEPQWRSQPLAFNSRTATFLGQPSRDNEQQITIVTVRAVDPLGQYNETTFNITVLPKLEVLVSIAPQPWVKVAGRFFNESINLKQIFRDTDRVLNYSTQSYDKALNLTWLTNYTNELDVEWIAGIPPLLQIHNISMSYSIPLFITVRDDAGQEASTPLTILVHPNYPPEAKILPKKWIKTGEKQTYYILTSNFIDKNGDRLHYHVNHTPHWLKQIDINEQMIVLEGRPKPSDTHFFYPATDIVTITASDDYNETVSASFEIEVGGESEEAVLIKRLLGAGISATFLFKILIGLIDRWRYDQTKRPDQEIEIGQPFSIELETPRNLTDSVTVEEPRRVDRLHRFFKPREALQATLYRLPALLQPCGKRFVQRVPNTSYLLLPYDVAAPWIKHDNTDGNNVVRSKGPVPAIRSYKELRVTVRGGFFGLMPGYTQEHFFIKIKNNQQGNEYRSAMPGGRVVAGDPDEESPLFDRSGRGNDVEMDDLSRAVGSHRRSRQPDSKVV